MAKQAASFGTADSWAFGPGSNRRNGANGARSVPAREVLAGSPADYAQPAVFLAEVDEAPPAERHVWDQLPEERRRRGRRYVGKHCA